MAGAGDALLEHVRSGDQWDDAIYEISQTPGDLFRRLPDTLEIRFGADELIAIVHRWRYEIPLDELGAGHAWIQSAIDRFDERPRRPGVAADPPSMELSAAELLQHDWPGVLPKRLLRRLSNMLRRGEREELLAALDREGSGRFVAFQALARLDDPAGLPTAERILVADKSGRNRREAIRYVSNLAPVHTLALARSWLRADDGRRVAAQNVLANYAESRDVPVLLAGAEAAWTDRDFYGLRSYIDAFARLPDDIPIGLITEVAYPAISQGRPSTTARPRSKTSASPPTRRTEATPILTGSQHFAPAGTERIHHTSRAVERTLVGVGPDGSR